ncbi:nuclear transport factor 2 family protein [Streptomyces sp. SID3343]|uniref:nuclear transport factor 2 family protein n=1 Tax=Streptomyces sp. SID3343 TaxID=2690260 RepID=UPI00136BE0E2|nr:nuclear transport factor 2 family protein [Streptomyces sp. SID3343]MYW04370.1 nuclear transport factor 2 family protein [Streptomyces sp. SID3343]
MTKELSPVDLAEIHRTLALFAHVFDNGDEDGLGLVFTDDVRVEIGAGPGRVFEGVEEFAEYVRGKSAATPDHHTLNTVVVVDEHGQVQTRSRYIGINPAGRLTSGEFLDILRHTEAGWRIAYRRSLPRAPRNAGAGVPRIDFPLAVRLPEVTAP